MLARRPGDFLQAHFEEVTQIGEALGYPITCVGVPKTVDNDLPHTDCCPGFGSVAKYVAVSTREAALDVASMARTSTKVFVTNTRGSKSFMEADEQPGVL